MTLEFFNPQGADCAFYMQKAAICASGGNCWTPRHCFGFIYYASLPYRFGWRPEALIGMGMLLLAVSIGLAGKAFEVLIPGLKGRGFFFNMAKYLVVSVAHLAWTWGFLHGFTADVPAACVALVGLWLLILAFGGNSAWLLALSGLFIGIAFSLRNAYLYPAYFILAAGFFSVFWLRRLSLSAMAGFTLMLALPILSQYALTYRHLARWSALDPALMAYYEANEKSLVSYGTDIRNQDPVYGCDGITDHLYWYTCGDCLSGTGGWAGAVQRNDWLGLVKLIWMRNGFYFGSYIFKPCLEFVEERIFSTWLWIANIWAALGLLLLFARSKERWILTMPLAYLAGVWALGIVLHPETRYMMAVFIFMWSAGPLYFLSRRFPGPGAQGLPDRK